MFLLTCLFSIVAMSACGGDDPAGDSQPGVQVTVSPQELTAPADGGSYTLQVSCTGREWTASADESAWLSVSVAGSASQSGTVSVSVGKNTAAVARTGTVTVRSGSVRKYVTVTQDAALAPLAVSQTEVPMTSAAATATVGVTGRTAFSAQATESWLKADVRDGAVVISAEANAAHSNRRGRVTVSDPTSTGAGSTAVITVVQEGAEVADVTLPDWAMAEGYQLVWHDEFNEGATLNAKDWTHEVQGPGWVNNELQTYVNGQAGGQRVTELVDGKLRIHCFKNGGKVYSGRVYAHVGEGWQYGYMEARLQLPKGRGTWPAFWMMPVTVDWQNEGWPLCGEIDIMEEVGANANYVSSSLHALGHYHANNTQITHEMLCSGAEDDFHTYAIRWTEQNITTYVDGQVQLSYDNDGTGVRNWPYSKPYYLILNLAWGGDWGGYKGIDESVLPTTMKVDYVRVFQK